MLRNIVHKIAPESYNYAQAEWYLKLKKNHDTYELSLLKICIAGGLLVITCLTLMNMAAGYTTPLLFYIGLALLAAGLVFSFSSYPEKNRILRIFMLIFSFSGFMLASVLPMTRGISLMLFFLTPIISIEHFGRTRGCILSLFMLVSGVLLYALYQAGIIGYWNVQLSPSVYLVIVIVYLQLLFLMLAIKNHNRKNLELLIKSLFYDNNTPVLNRMILTGSLNSETEYLLAIIQIANYTDLRTIFGYDAYDTLFNEFIHHVNAWSHNYPHSIFKLKSNELAVLIEKKGDEACMESHITQPLVHHCLSKKFEFKGSAVWPHIVIGAVSASGQNSSDILTMADLALKQAHMNHTTYAFYNEEETIRDSAITLAERFNILYENIRNEAYMVLFQPVYNSEGSAPAFYECLMRLNDGAGNNTSIEPFLGIAKSMGMEMEITRCVIERACEFIRKNRCDVSININYSDMSHAEIYSYVEEGMEGITGNRLILEILETHDMTDRQLCLDFIGRMKQLNCLIALDDFGSGYANFSLLSYLPVDIVKIDGKLIRQITQNRKAEYLVDSIIQFCSKTGKEMVAEWIEDEETCTFIKRKGVQYLQGYYLGMPRKDAVTAELPV